MCLETSLQMNNIFSIVPWDVKQYEIGRFLSVIDRTAWNQALEKDERVFKKFTKHYIRCHQILVLSRKFNSMKKRLFVSENCINDNRILIDEVAVKKAETALLDICKFSKSPEFEFLANYSSLAKKVIRDGLEFYCSPDAVTPLYEAVPQTHSQYLAGCAAIAFKYTEFINLVSDTVGIPEHGTMLRDAGN
jgi:hypothetical protein